MSVLLFYYLAWIALQQFSFIMHFKLEEVKEGRQGEDQVVVNRFLQTKQRLRQEEAPFTMDRPGGNLKQKVHLVEWARKNQLKCRKKANSNRKKLKKLL